MNQANQNKVSVVQSVARIARTLQYVTGTSDVYIQTTAD